ncbi:MAG: hypothetical protein AAGJ93_01360 [Bacteroidota bacterium]
MTDDTNLIASRFFRFGAIAHQTFQAEVFKLIDLEDQLNISASSRDFTKLVNRIYFIPILSQINEYYEEETHYDIDSKKIIIKRRVSENTTAQQVLAESLDDLSSIYPSLQPLALFVRQALE